MPTSSQSSVTINTTSTGFISPSEKRVGLMIVPPAANRFTISLLPVAVLDQGITLYAGDRPIMLTFSEHGDLVRRGYTAISSVAAQSCSFLETFE